MLGPKGDLAAVELAFFGPAFLVGVYILFRHGFTRQMGWLYVVVLSILRIIGTSATLDMQVSGTASASLLETAAITSAVGTAPLLLALMGFLERINQGMEHRGLSLMLFRPLHLISLGALIIAIIGGTNEMHADTGDMQTGRSLMEAASLLFLAIFLALAGVTLFTVTNSRWVVANERTLLRACVVALPFILVRIAYTIAVAFSNKGGSLYFRDVSVWAQAFMQFLMEAIVISLFIVAGLMTPKMEKRAPFEGSRDAEMPKYETASEPTGQPGRGGPRQEERVDRLRTLGDYRPSKLIMNAIRDRR
ncbi:hypothetical protein LTR53_015952 [Teratosphaeriaceae sp. CCFEE 6253]|nr:hypothetical protein LTR53_015952 [Teratosphaeriaceae sp. CCFEE 6253]